MTFSIVALDPATGDLGVAVASKFLAVGSAVPFARAGIGAVATQALANVRYGPEGLALLADGVPASEVVARLTAADRARDHRQLGVVDAHGGSATYTGSACMAWAGGRTAGGRAADGVAVQGNILTGADIVNATLETYLAVKGRFADRLLAAMKAGDDAGGDSRGRQAAAILVVRAGAGYLGGDDRLVDLRVDDHADPIGELLRLRSLHAVMWDRPTADELIPLDEALVGEVRELLERVGAQPRSRDDVDLEALLDYSVEPIGTLRDAPGWTAADQSLLLGWMGRENLELRESASGWIDPITLDHLRETAAADTA